MARIAIGSICNVLTGNDSQAYRSAHPAHKVQPQITIPRFRARLYISEAKELIVALKNAVQIAEEELSKS